jgi:hypothetical protein
MLVRMQGHHGAGLAGSNTCTSTPVANVRACGGGRAESAPWKVSESIECVVRVGVQWILLLIESNGV